jgi:Phosphotransferase enzyme family
MDERALSGGNMGGAVQVGETVRKAAQPQSATIRRLLAHVRAQGVTWVPEPLGTDERGRDVWSFIPGEVVHDRPEWLWSSDVLTTVARRLRQWHDATATFEGRVDDVWWWRGKLPAEVICHNDFAPHNHVYQDGRFVGAIDFDICYPGPRLWDLADTAYHYLPLAPHVDDPLEDGSGWSRTQLATAQILERIDLFLDAYAGQDGHLRFPASALLGHVPLRLLAVAQWCGRQPDEALCANGVTYRAHARWLAEGALGRADVVRVRDA